MFWQRINTAPKDGTVILLTDGKHFAAGCFAFDIEKDWTYKGYGESQKGLFKIPGDDFLDRVPNPNAGKRKEWWTLFGCSAFDSDTDTNDYDGPVFFEPTHWMPLCSNFYD